VLETTPPSLAEHGGQATMPDQDKFPTEPPEPPPNLAKFNETTRSAVYAHVYRVAFLDPYTDEVGYRTGAEFPKDAAERAELQVFWAFGHWFAAWRDPELDQHLPLEHRWEVVQIKSDPDAAGGLMLHGV